MTVPSFDPETYEILKQHVHSFENVTPCVLMEISNFNWLWPVVEAACFQGKASQDNISEFFINANTQQLL